MPRLGLLASSVSVPRTLIVYAHAKPNLGCLVPLLVAVALGSQNVGRLQTLRRD